jgi:hypothetical protein
MKGNRHQRRCNVLGFGFMDKEELGERLVQAWQKKHGA